MRGLGTLEQTPGWILHLDVGQARKESSTVGRDAGILVDGKEWQPGMSPGSQECPLGARNVPWEPGEPTLSWGAPGPEFPGFPNIQSNPTLPQFKTIPIVLSLSVPIKIPLPPLPKPLEGL